MSEDCASSLKNVLGQIRAEHCELRALLSLYAEEPSKLVREHLLTRLCRAIRLHCTVEAGVFVPAVAAASGNPHLLEQTGADYAFVMGMINELAAPQGLSEKLEERVRELNDYVDKHIAVAESEEGVLTQAERLALDWAALETEIENRRADLGTPTCISSERLRRAD